ncbi:MAG: Co2+/Mg2+ efflux protein ApaG [Phycisphaerales bacterium]|nr:Co2+/Mg2+ efflux protein ApaG [Phycisphaerales bacterium]
MSTRQSQAREGGTNRCRGSEAVTRGIRVEVRPTYAPDQSHPASGKYVFAYRVRISNQSDQTVRLLSRRWLIIDADGCERIVEGDGVVGRQPELEPGGHFEYESFCPLETAWGTMQGTYFFEGETEPFEVRVARFYLVADEG